MKKTEWNEGSVARKEAAGKKKEAIEMTVVRKAGNRKPFRNGQANFTAEIYQDAIRGIINNQVP